MAHGANGLSFSAFSESGKPTAPTTMGRGRRPVIFDSDIAAWFAQKKAARRQLLIYNVTD